MPFAVVDKRRPKPNIAEATYVVGNVDGMNCFLIDDLADTLGTLTGAAAKLKEHGAKRILAACTHGLLSGPAVERLAASPIEKLLITDTTPFPQAKQIDRLEIITVAPLFAKAIDLIHTNRSVAMLFD